MPVGPIVPIHRPAPPQGFVSDDGTLLTVTRASGQITGFCAESKDSHKYALSLETFSSPAADVSPNLKPWCAARMSLSDNGDDPLQFGFAYCPLEEQFDIFLERQNVSTGIAVNLQPLVLQPNGSILGSATLSRDLTYYKNSFGTQTLGMDPESTDPVSYTHLDVYKRQLCGSCYRKEPMPPTPATSLLLEGTVTLPPTSNLFMRLRQKGPLTQFVEFLEADIADPALGPFPPNSIATELVKMCIRDRIPGCLLIASAGNFVGRNAFRRPSSSSLFWSDSKGGLRRKYWK